MKTRIIFILLFCNLALLYGQKEAANWYFGEKAGLDFNGSNPVGLTGELDTREGCASISNGKGSLLFYTDGFNVWNRNHNLMPNGTELFGNNSSTQSAIIVPKPKSNHIYYIFTVDNAEILFANVLNKGLNYTEIDMNLNNGLGDVVTTSKNIHLITYDENDEDQVEWKCSEKIAAIQHQDENSFWVVTHFVDTFYSFKVDENGVVEVPVKTKVNEVIDIVEYIEIGSVFSNISALGYLKISPNGKKLGIVHSSTLESRVSGKAYLYDFDDATGMVSSSGTLLLKDTYPYGMEFSPKSRKLYISINKYVPDRDRNASTTFTFYKFESSSIFQYDIQDPDIISSKKEIHQSTNLLAGALQLAIDGKIYRAKFNQPEVKGLGNLAAINNPELSGDLCNYDNNAVALANNTSSRYGLPPFISSFFLLTFDFEYTCYGDATHFFITSDFTYDSLIWDFGDGTTSTEDDPSHTFANDGTYTVTVSTTTNGQTDDPVIKEVNIVNKIEVMDTPYQLIECDVNDDESDDGITTFNLELANDPISLGNGDSVLVQYYNDLNTLNNDKDNSSALPLFYTNSVPNELIYAKVTKSNSDCYSIGEVILKTSSISNDFISNKYTSCNLGDGTGLFDLGSQKEILKTNLSLPSSSSISFHFTKSFAALGYEALEDSYISEPKTIYLRIENENFCYGIGELTLDIFDIPNIKLNEELTICKSSFPFKINSGIGSSEHDNYSFVWGNGSRMEEIEIFDEGIYKVSMTDISASCTYLRTINVITNEQPEINEIEIIENLNSYTAIIKANGANGLLYSLNNDFGIYRNDSSFSDLSPGTYTAYITDQSNCYTVEKQFYIFGFPKFFTPNNDGINDVWEIKGTDFNQYTYSDIQIFNRFGKHLVTIHPNSHWDGIYNGKYLPADDYWFYVSITDKDNITNIHKGHFSLIGR